MVYCLLQNSENTWSSWPSGIKFIKPIIGQSHIEQPEELFISNHVSFLQGFHDTHVKKSSNILELPGLQIFWKQ